MNLFRLFGLGSDAILSQGHFVPGKVTRTYTCWWVSIKVKAVRICATPENTKHPHIITFTYTADNTPREGKLWVPYNIRVPQPGEEIPVYYDPSDPSRYACYAFGPASGI